MSEAVTVRGSTAAGRAAWQAFRRGPRSSPAFDRLPVQMRASLSWAAYEEAWDAWARGDVDALLELWGPDTVIELGGLPSWPERDVYRGTEELRQFAEDWIAAWRHLSFTTRAITVDGPVVLAAFEMSGRGAASGAAVEMLMWQVAESPGGQVHRMAHFADESEARDEFARAVRASAVSV